jgi:hypothetical protein
MPTVHPQVQKARDLMPLIAAASDENDEIRELTKPVVAPAPCKQTIAERWLMALVQPCRAPV